MDQGRSEIGFYSKLPDAVKSKSGAPADVPVNQTTKMFTPGFIDRIVNPNVSDVKSTETFKTRAEGRMILLTSTFKDKSEASTNTVKRVGEAQIVKKPGRKTITSRERRKLKIYDIPKEVCKHDLFLPLNSLWNQYIESLLTGKNPRKTGSELLQSNDARQQQQLLNKLIKADMHGARMRVERSKCPNFIGISGIVAQETKNVFKIITKQDKMAVVPKLGCVFALELESGAECLIYGDQFAFRASDRASRKFKTKPSIALS
ncbi:RNase P/RNase MRP complex subunit [Coemansia sp. Benny D115]|nr:RNase P/RNase MRP complex subunit [Coemansia sp. Benny D115]